MQRRTVAWVAIVWTLAAACGDDAVTGRDGGAVDAGAPDGGGGASGGGGPVRAWVLRADDLPSDPHGLATWRVGDVALRNERIAVIVESAGESDLYDPWGGKLVGVTQVQDGRLVHAADFNEVIHGLGRFVPEVTDVEIVDDGSDGEVARVRSRGTLGELPFIADFARSLFPVDHALDVELEYEIARDTDHVDVYLTLDNAGGEAGAIADVTTLIFQRERMQPFVPGPGFAIPGAGKADWIGFIEDGETSWAFASPNGPLTIPVPAQAGFDLLLSPKIMLKADARTRVHLARIFVASPGLDGLQAVIAREAGDSLREITGGVHDQDGVAVAGAHVHALAKDGAYLTRASTDAEGRYAIHVPDAAVELVAYAQGYAQAEEALAGNATEVDLTLTAGRLRISIADAADGTPLPARVQVTPVAAMDDPPAEWGEVPPGEGRVHLAFPTEGEVVLPVPPGDHRVVVAHGFEYDIHDETISVAAGAEVAVKAKLSHVVLAPEVLCTDTHVHTWRSPDAGDDPMQTVAAIAGEGLELALRTDHEWVGDFAHEVAALGFEDTLYPMIAEELTTFVYGHFNVFGLTVDDAAPNDGAISWYGMNPPELFQAIHEHPDHPAFSVNHPRSRHPLLGAREGYFEYAGYDPVTGEVDAPAAWSEDFRVIEAFNAKSFEEERDGTVRDWFSFLDRGRQVFVVGASDSHTVRTSPIGYPRTCLHLGDAVPDSLTTQLVRDAIDEGRSTISGGVHVTASVDDAGPGQTATGTGATAALKVRVEAPAWVDVTTLEVFVDGERTQEIALDPGAGVVRYDDVIDVPVAAGGSWVVVHALGAAELAPVYAGRLPFGVTNPIFLER